MLKRYSKIFSKLLYDSKRKWVVYYLLKVMWIDTNVIIVVNYNMILLILNRYYVSINSNSK